MTSATAIISSSATSATNEKKDRLVSLDVFRGLAVAGMILVTDPGTYSAVYWPLLHAQWNGWTPTDMIFPGFLFAVGVAITLSLASRMERGFDSAKLARHVVVRSVVIFIIGLAVNGDGTTGHAAMFPYLAFGSLTGTNPDYFRLADDTLETTR